jgi:hypothetical protein
VDIAKFLRDNKFEPAGKIRRISSSEVTSLQKATKNSSRKNCVREQKLHFELNEKWKSPELVGLVYLWVVVNKNSIVGICYVGKAGKTLRKRCREHEQGFRGPACNGSNSGLEKRNRICEFLDQGLEVQVYARASKTGVFFGQEVSLCASEENAAIEACRAMNQCILNGRVSSS